MSLFSYTSKNNIIKKYAKLYITSSLKTTCLLITLIMLQSCSSMLIVGTTAFITANTWNDPRTIGTQLDDKILEQYITHAINKNQNIKKIARIVSTAYQGNVLLTGESPSLNLSNKAVDITTHIPGVKKIYNAIRIEQPIDFQKILYDTWISTKIYVILLAKKNTHISNVKVTTENKEVFLLGKVTYLEGQYMEKTAKKINGVTRVFTIFEYT